jgi:FtsZ-binding cell division protein ZapB
MDDNNPTTQTLIADIREDIESFGAEIEELRDENQRLVAENEELRKKIEKLETRNQELRAENQQLMENQTSTPQETDEDESNALVTWGKIFVFFVAYIVLDFSSNALAGLWTLETDKEKYFVAGIFLISTGILTIYGGALNDLFNTISKKRFRE